jgi:cytochrome c556
VNKLRKIVCFAALSAVTLGGLSAIAAEKAPPRRAKPPVWTPDVLDAFFTDAREHLVGERPAQAEATMANVASAANAASPAVDPTQPFAWSKVIEGDSLDAEVKRIVAGLREPLANPAKFKAGGYKQCRADFSMLAVLFGVIAEHDGDVRWQEDAAALRDALARAAMNCKTATDQTFAEASQRRADLEDLVRGERLGGDKPAGLEKWSQLADRPLLMQRMEKLLQEEISPALGNAKEFTKRAPDIRQKAELLAVLADVTQREEYEYWDDAGFQELSTDLRNATAELTRAAVETNYEAARAAAGRATQACSACHEGYRG